MLLSIFTDEIHQDPTVFLPFLRERGLRFAEIRMVRGRRYPDLDPRDMKELPRILAGEGVQVSALSPGLFKGAAGPEGEIPASILEGPFLRALEEASRFDCRKILVFAPDRPAGAAREGPLPGRLLEGLFQAARLARERGLTLFLENEPGSWADTGAAAARLLKTLDHPSLRANWDPANALFAGEERPWEGGFRELAPWVGHVHVKDVLPAGSGPGAPRFVPLGEGALDWAAQLRALARAGYQGFLTLETHCEPLSRTTPRSLDRLESLLAALPPGGDGKAP